MATRATHSASATTNDDSSLRHLLELSHDELGVIVDGLVDPLEPVVAVSLSSTCKGLRTPLRAALEMLRQKREKAEALCRKVGVPSLAWLRSAKELVCDNKDLSDDDMASLSALGWLLEAGDNQPPKGVPDVYGVVRRREPPPPPDPAAAGNERVEL